MINKSKAADAEKTTAFDAGKMILSDSSPFTVTESYKALRTNIAFALPGAGSKVIGVTSGSRAEGKSINAINIAISFAQIGKRTILLDCDMRLPTIASKLSLTQKPGLSDLLIFEAKPSEVIRVLPSGLEVMPAGSIPKDPTGLLESEVMGNLLKKLKEVYDYVIIDLPPMTTVTDAAILSPYIDGFMVVVRHEITTFKEVKEVLRQMSLSDAKVLGFVYNDVPVEEKKYYKYGYYGKNK